MVIGQDFQLSGLKGRSELNGRTVFVQKRLKNGRFSCAVYKNGEGQSGIYSEIISIKQENLRPISAEPNPLSKSMNLNTCFALPISVAITQPFRYFYPFGNTSAKMILSSIQSASSFFKSTNEKEKSFGSNESYKAKDLDTILLLGCGDPRHVLYTSWQLSHSKERSKKGMDVTMVDIETSIIARNIVLFKLAYEQSLKNNSNDKSNDRSTNDVDLRSIELGVVWSLFYSKKIDEYCMSVLQQCANDLLNMKTSAGDADERDFNIIDDMFSFWNNHYTFGKIIRFCDRPSFEKVRTIWKLYSRGKLSLDEEIRRVNERKKILLSKSTKHMDGALGMCPFMKESITDLKRHVEIGQDYLSTEGKSPDCIYKNKSTGMCNKNVKLDSRVSFLNPMILCGTKQLYNIHYSLDPTMGFHKSLLYARTIKQSASSSLKTSTRSYRPIKVNETNVYRMCFEQFEAWLTNFGEMMKTGNIIIRN
eukprot:Awhi_evm1s6146